MIGVDVGFGYVKPYPSDDNQTFASVYVDYVERDYKVEGDIMDNLEIEFDGSKYFIGSLAQLEGGIGSFSITDMLKHKLFILTAICLSNKMEDYCGSVVLGLPVSDLSKVKENLLLLKGKYSFTFCGKKMNVELTNVYVIPQGTSAYFDLLFNEEGRPVSNLSEKKIGIIDIGEKTLDYVCMDRNRFIVEKSGSTKLGMHVAYNRLQPIIQKDLNISCKAHQVRNYTSRIQTKANSAFRRLANEIVSTLGVPWDFDDFDSIYVLGGGANDLHKHINEHIKCILVPKPQISNARGLYKCGKAAELQQQESLQSE